MFHQSSKGKLLSEKHSVFTIHPPVIEFSKDYLDITHRFSISGGLSFAPSTRIYGSPTGKESTLTRLAILASMVESLSYWKSCFSPKIIVEPLISREALEWFQDLLLNGMMEYRYTNALPALFMPEIIWQQDSGPIVDVTVTGPASLVMVSGGKDSTVTLSVLHQQTPIKAFILNELPAAERVLSEFPDVELVKSTRNIDPALLELNKQNYLNGHTPFSALLSVLSTIAAILNDCRVSIASNESSAEYPFAVYDGCMVNHQYSKSLQYEAKFAKLIKMTLPNCPEYFSLLRPLTEPQICLLLSKRKDLLSLISSCNRNQLSGTWCGCCPKCVSTWLLLQPFVDSGELARIFGKNAPEEGKALLPALLGHSDCRPLECVGTPEELNASLLAVEGDLAPLNGFLHQFGTHLIPKEFESILKRSLDEALHA
jgi:UDP-N-acetyl-alpha-D-muramoyl-L-alanyl-L-glutamate epimerase